jgi:hypothetical protein
MRRGRDPDKRRLGTMSSGSQVAEKQKSVRREAPSALKQSKIRKDRKKSLVKQSDVMW